MTNEAFDYL